MEIFAEAAYWYTATLTFLASCLSILLAIPIGSSLAARAQPSRWYLLTLTLLLLPFAFGSSVWGYSISNLVVAFGASERIVFSDTGARFCLILCCILAKTVPLGVYFFSTSLHVFTSKTRLYFNVHEFGMSFAALCGIRQISNATVALVGIFSGAIMACESALPKFIYRANGGTQPETLNLLLWRIWRNVQQTNASEATFDVAVRGVYGAVGLFIVSVAGAVLGKLLVVGIVWIIRKIDAQLIWNSRLFDKATTVTVSIACLPGLVALVGLLLPLFCQQLFPEFGWVKLAKFLPIAGLGALVGISVVSLSLIVAIQWRFATTRCLEWLGRNTLSTGFLTFSAFLPAISIIGALSYFTRGSATTFSQFSAICTSHFLLHFPVFLFVCLALVETIPDYHVTWLQRVRMKFSFLLMVEGILRFKNSLIALIGLCTVLVITDGSIAPWFSNLIQSPEDSLHGALLGRNANRFEAMIIGWLVGGFALLLSSLLSFAFTNDLRRKYAGR